MKYLYDMKLFEQIKRINSIIDNSLITEASKFKILTDKIGLSNFNAKYLDEKCGPLSVWMANKIIDHVEQPIKSLPDKIEGNDNIQYVKREIRQNPGGAIVVEYVEYWNGHQLSSFWVSNERELRNSISNRTLSNLEYNNKKWLPTKELPTFDIKKDINLYVTQVLNDNGINKYNQMINGIMDWIRIGLNGDIKNVKENSFHELYTKSKEWHDSLDIGEGQINYVETGDIVKDFRNINGDGFYWVNTKTNDCPEEAKRMGHCGRTGKWNTIYSLRSYKRLNPKFTLNKSHLTASISDDGILYQLKGPKNSKPKPELHNYILALFYLLGDSGEEYDYLIKGFGTEYASEYDFKLSDLPDDVIIDLYKNRPELFNTRALQRKLRELGIIEKVELDYNITIRTTPSALERYIDGGWIVSRRKVKRTSPAGNEYETTVEIDVFETILSGDMWDLYENFEYADWKSALDYDCDDENAKLIEDIVRKMAEDNSDFDEEEFNEMSLEDKINEFDDDYEIRRAIKNAVSNAESDEYHNYLYKQLEEAIEKYGEIIVMNDEEVSFKVDTREYFEDLSDDEFEDYMERCNDEVDCVFEEMVYDGSIDKPMFDVDSRYSPDMDSDNFNQILYDYLNELI